MIAHHLKFVAADHAALVKRTRALVLIFEVADTNLLAFYVDGIDAHCSFGLLKASNEIDVLYLQHELSCGYCIAFFDIHLCNSAYDL